MSSSHDRFWAKFFGVAATDFGSTGVSVVAHVGLAGYRGIWFFLRGTRLIVSAPDAWVSHVEAQLAGAIPELPSANRISQVLGPDVDCCIGPVLHGALDASTFRPAPSIGTRPLLASDRDALAVFRAGCSADDWTNSGVEQAPLYRTAYFERGAICAMAAFRPWSSTAGGPSVLTHPDHRGVGLAARVVTPVLASALADDYLVLYQTLEANLPAVRLALSLGYARYATHLAVRLHSDRPLT